MKMFRLAAVIAIVLACGFGGSTGAREVRVGRYETEYGGRNSRLLILRESDFGTFIYLKVYIDSVPVTLLGRNVGYEAIVRPGEHVISISTTPNPYGQTRHYDRKVSMRSGETYAFTATWLDSDRASLETSSEADINRLASIRR